MPLYTLIALLLSMFGATVALLSALRSHHGGTITTISDNFLTRCNEIRASHLEDGEMVDEVKQIEASIKKWLGWWGKMMVVPIWIFSFVVVILAIGVLSTPWEPPTANSPPLSPSFDWLIIHHCLPCKFAIGILLLLNIGCYAMAMVAQKNIRDADKLLKTLKKSIAEQQARSLELGQPA